MGKIWWLSFLILWSGCSPNAYKKHYDPFESKGPLESAYSAAAEADPIPEQNAISKFSLDQEKFKTSTVNIIPTVTKKSKPKATAALVPAPTPTLSAVQAPVEKKRRIKRIQMIEERVRAADYPQKDYPPSYKEYDKKSLSVWKLFKPNIYVGTKIELAVKYLGFVCGSIYIYEKEIVRAGKGQRPMMHYFGRTISAPFYESFYKLDDTIESYVDLETFTPFKFVIVQRESKQSVDDLQLSDMDQLKNYYSYKRINKRKEVKEESREVFLPNLVLDSLTPLFFIRGLPLKMGDIYEIPVLTRGEVWMLKVKVAAEESLTFQGKTYEALRLDAETHFPGVLKKRGDIYFWVTKDEVHLPLKFMAKVKIGKIEGDLVTYSLGTKVNVEEYISSMPVDESAAPPTSLPPRGGSLKLKPSANL